MLLTLSSEEACKNIQLEGVDFFTSALCKKIRGLAKLDRLRLDEGNYRLYQNTHLFDYIEFCGMEPLKFVKEYLSNLQPYMIFRNQLQERDDRYFCNLDNQYSISIYFTFNIKQYEEIVVSFHENHIRELTKGNCFGKNNNLVPIFAENVLAHTEKTDMYVVRTIIQRGMLALPLELATRKSADVFLVEINAINLAMLDRCNSYLQDLYTSDLKLDFSNIEIFSILQQISYTSYGKDIFSTMSLLIDNLFIQADTLSRRAADFAMTIYAQSLVLTAEQKQDLCALLEERYRFFPDKKISCVLKHIQNNLYIIDDIF